MYTVEAIVLGHHSNHYLWDSVTIIVNYVKVSPVRDSLFKNISLWRYSYLIILAQFVLWIDPLDSSNVKRIQ